MKKIPNIREALYEQDLNRAARMKPSEKLKLTLELSDFCRYLRSKTLIKKREK